MPGLRRSPAATASAEPDASGQGRLFEHLLLFLNRLAGVAPMLLLIEDIHWADLSTLDLLAFLVRNLRSRIVLIASYRTNELHRRHPLLPVVAGFERTGRVERLELARFDRREVAEQLEGILGSRPDPDLAEGIYLRSEGNAFFAEELLATGASRDELPDTLREVLIERFGALDRRAQELVRVASAAGPRIRTGLLAAVMGVDERALEAGLRGGCRRQDPGPIDRRGGRWILVPPRTPPGSGLRRAAARRAHAPAWGIRRSPVPRGAVRGRPLPVSRARLPLARRPRPAAGAGSFGPGGLAADAMYAFAEARASYEVALELWDRVPDAAALSPLDQVDLLTRAAATAQVSAVSRAAAHMQAAVDLVDPKVDPFRAGLLISYLGIFLIYHDGERGLAALRDGARIVPSAPPSAARARVLTALGGALAAFDRHRESRPVLEEAVRVAREVATGYAERGRSRRSASTSRRHGASRARPSRRSASTSRRSARWRRVLRSSPAHGPSQASCTLPAA